MDKRAVLAIILSLAVLLLWQAFLAPKPPPPEAALPGPASGASSPAGAEPAAPTSGSSTPESGSIADSGTPTNAPAEDKLATPRRESPPGAPRVVVETDLARIEIERVGGKVVSWTLKKYLDDEGRPYELVSPDSHRTEAFPLRFKLQDKALEGLLNARASFDVERGPRAGAEAPASAVEAERSTADPPAKQAARGVEGGGEEVSLIFSDGRGLEARKTLVLAEGSYLVEVRAEIRRSGEPVPGEIVWGPGIGTPSAVDLKNSYYDGGSAIADSGTGATRLTGRQLSGPALIEGVRWTGLEEKYFAAVFIPADGPAASDVFVVSVPAPTPQGQPSARPPVTLRRVSVGVPIGTAYLLYAGPKDYGLLSSLNRGLTDLVNFHPMIPLIGPILGPLIGMLAKFLWASLRWLNSYIPNYGVDIIIVTTIIKIAFYPITQRAMVKMRGEQKKMQRVAPKVNAIKEKFRKLKDAAARAKMNEEIMALYKREGINPMASLGGCLPMLVQLPILYGFLQVLTVSIELRHAPFFGWIQDLSRPDPYYITPIFMGLTMFVQQKMAMTTVTDPQQRMQQRMMLIMPIVFTYFFLNLPSGLVLYWSVNNILGIVQQTLINRQARAVEARELAAVGKA